MQSFIDTAGRKEWREHWPVVVTTMMGLMFSLVHISTVGVMIAPLEHEFGWSRAQITSGLLFIALVGFPLSPFLGLAIDRFGPRSIALFGMALYSVALAALSLAQQPIWTWCILWLFLAFAFLFVSPTVWVAAITSLFSASRGLALGVVLSATGLTALVTPFLTYTLVANFGWRLAFVFLGGLAAVITLPLIYIFFSSAKDQGWRKNSTVRVIGSNHPATSALAGVSAREGLRSTAFIKLALVAALMSLIFNALFVNFVPILTSSGIHPARAAAITGLAGATTILGRLGAGILLDRFNARLVGAVTVTFPIFSCLLLIVFAGSTPAASVALLLFGFSPGAEVDALSYLASRLFGLRNFGALFGIIIGFITLGIGAGPVLASLIYEVSGSYLLDLWIAIPLCLVSSYCLFSLGPFPEFDQDEQTNQSSAQHSQ